MALASGRPVSEAQLVAAWEERRYPPDGLVDSLGRGLQVVFPGRRSGGPGPDFKGALIALRDGTLLRGDVEVHRRTVDWVRHGHAADPRYARVILHVVHEVDGPVTGWDGALLASVALPLGSVVRFPTRPPCLRDPDEVERVVLEAGRARFRSKAARFEADLAAASADQVAWRGIAEALGYSRNTRAFGLLADVAPWGVAAAASCRGGHEAVAGLLLEAAGLGHLANPAEWRAWRASGYQPAELPLAPSVWERAALRPANDPVTRCRGLALLAERFVARSGPAAATLEAVRSAADARSPLWRQVAVQPWVGRGRAQAVVVNVLLPFAAALGEAAAEPLFGRLSGEPANEATRYMLRLLGGSPRRFATACHRQGLVALFKETCAQRACDACPAADRWSEPFAVSWR